MCLNHTSIDYTLKIYVKINTYFNKDTNMLPITQTILNLRQEYVPKQAPSYYEINNGLCEEFALEIISLLNHPDDIQDVCGENFMRGEDGEEHENDVWDWKLLKKYWNIIPPKGLTEKEMDNIGFGAHVFLTHKGKFYDSECPHGVDSFFDLPVYRRPIIYALRQKGIPTEEVLPEDILPPPLCPIPNPSRSLKPILIK